jgi:hypothetical protein
MSLGKVKLATPIFIIVAWTLMISYHLFTRIAVTTVVEQINLFQPSLGAWFNARIDMMVFIYAFAWVFVLSSIIPSVILGKERSVLIQFLAILTLTFMAIVIRDILTVAHNYETIDQVFTLAELFKNPLLAMMYLSMPFLLMLMLDIRFRTKRSTKEILE